MPVSTQNNRCTIKPHRLYRTLELSYRTPSRRPSLLHGLTQSSTSRFPPHCCHGGSGPNPNLRHRLCDWPSSCKCSSIHPPPCQPFNLTGTRNTDVIDLITILLGRDDDDDDDLPLRTLHSILILSGWARFVRGNKKKEQ